MHDDDDDDDEVIRPFLFNHSLSFLSLLFLPFSNTRPSGWFRAPTQGQRRLGRMND